MSGPFWKWVWSMYRNNVSKTAASVCGGFLMKKAIEIKICPVRSVIMAVQNRKAVTLMEQLYKRMQEIIDRIDHVI